jgi:hypothetical protein
MEMEIGEVVRRSVVVLDASWPPDQGRRLISDLSPTHIVIKRTAFQKMRYFTRHPDVKPFASAYSWAPFIYIGA